MELPTTAVTKPTRVLTCVRVRPVAESERRAGFRNMIELVPSLDAGCKMLVFDPSRGSADEEEYDADGHWRVGHKKAKNLHMEYDRVFDGHSTQQEVFDGTTACLIDDVMEGFPATVFAYGATGSGKCAARISHTAIRADQNIAMAPHRTFAPRCPQDAHDDRQQ